MASLKRKKPDWLTGNSALNLAIDTPLGGPVTTPIDIPDGLSAKKARTPAKSRAKAAPKQKVPPKAKAPPKPKALPKEKAPPKPRGRPRTKQGPAKKEEEPTTKSPPLQIKSKNGLNIKSDPSPEVDLSTPLSRSPSPQPPPGFNPANLRNKSITQQAFYIFLFIKAKNCNFVDIEDIEEKMNITLTNPLINILASNPSLTYSRDHGFKYNNPYGINSAEEILARFQNQPHYSFLMFSELEQGWLDAEKVVADLEANGHVLVLMDDHKKAKKVAASRRAGGNKKKSKKEEEPPKPKQIYPNQREFDSNVLEQFREIYHSIKLDGVDIRKELEMQDLQPQQQEPERKKPGMSRAGGKKKREVKLKDNSHMAGMLMSSEEHRRLREGWFGIDEDY